MDNKKIAREAAAKSVAIFLSLFFVLWILGFFFYSMNYVDTNPAAPEWLMAIIFAVIYIVALVAIAINKYQKTINKLENNKTKIDEP